MTFHNITEHADTPFDQYLKLPGYSHSFLKGENNGIARYVKITDNITIGKLVDGILTSPGDVDISNPLYPHAKEIAAHIKGNFGAIINRFVPQVSLTGTITMGDFSMPVKGRLDWLLRDIAVIDLKCTMSKDIDALIEYMGYVNQVWGYAKMANVLQGYILAYSIPLKKVVIRKIDCRSEHNSFWADKVLSFGSVAHSDEQGNIIVEKG